VADVEDDAALAGAVDHVLDAPLAVDGGVRERAEGVREDVAGPQALDHLLVARRRMVDVAHERHADLVGDLQRDVERRRARGAARVQADADLDADDEVAVGIATSTASRGAIMRISALSPTMMVFEKA
jgi:hypothetical protein